MFDASIHKDDAFPASLENKAFHMIDMIFVRLDHSKYPFETLIAFAQEQTKSPQVTTEERILTDHFLMNLDDTTRIGTDDIPTLSRGDVETVKEYIKQLASVRSTIQAGLENMSTTQYLKLVDLYKALYEPTIQQRLFVHLQGRREA